MAGDALAGVYAAVADQAPTVVLDREVLGDERLTASWERLLGRGELRLAGAVVSEPGADGAFRVTGTVALPPFGDVPAELDVFAGTPHAEDGPAPVEVLLRVSDPITSWTLSGDFPDLPGHLDAATGGRVASFLDGLALPDVTVVLSSVDAATDPPSDPALAARAILAGRGVQAGLNLACALDTTGAAWRTVRLAVPGLPDAPSASGVLRLDGEDLAVAFRIPVKGTTWSPAPAIALGLDEVLVESPLSAGSPGPPRFTLAGHLDAGTAAVPFAIEVALGEPAVRIRGGDPAHPLTLSDVLTALGLDHGDLAAGLPPGATPAGLGPVGLASFEIDAGLAPAGVRRISAVLASAQPLGLLGGLVTLEPHLVVEAREPFGAPSERSLDLTISGTWLIGGSAIDVAYRSGIGQVAARLRPGEVLDLGALVADVVSDTPAFVVGLPDLAMTGDVHTGAYEIRLDLEDAFDVVFGAVELAVREVQVSFVNDGAGSATWHLEGSLAVAGVHLRVAAERTAGEDWLIDARGGVDGTLDLAGLLREAFETFHGPGQAFPAGIPGHFATIAVREVVVHVDTAEQVLQLYADLALDLDVVHGLTFTHLTTSAEFDDQGLVDCWIDAALTLGGVEIDLTSAFSAERGLEFRGESPDGHTIPIGHVLADLARMTGIDAAVPAAVEGLVVEKIAIAYAPTTGALSVRLDGDLPGTSAVRVHTVLDLTRVDGGYRTHLSGELVVGALRFDLGVAADPARATIAATYTGDAAVDVSLGALAAAIDPALASHVPTTLSLRVDEIVLAHDRDAGGSRSIIALALSGSIDLSGLPLVGAKVADSLRLAFEPIVVSADYSAEQVQALVPLLGSGPIEIPAAGVEAGVHLQTRLDAGQQTWRLGLPITTDAGGNLTPGVPPGTGPTPPSSAADDTRWFTIGRTFGPVHIDRVGLSLHGGDLTASLDGRLTLGPLSLELLALAATASLDDLVPRFSLHGLALDYRAGDLEVGGAFLHQRLVRGGVTEDVYAGKVLLKTSSFALSAMGEYAEHEGHPSLFVYAVLDKPLGGPTFFFVTGLAAGLGYNREMVLPAVDRVADFPLVQEATGTVPAAGSLGEELTRLGDAVPPRTGGMFLAAGVKFNSFGIIDSFVLLAVNLGPRPEIDLLGLSHAVIPPPEAGRTVPPLAVVELAISARFLPDEGSLVVRGQLTPASFLLSASCRLHGGFAFAAWFGPEHAGDFVVTLGGYHPHYVPEPHYPKAPRLGFDWPVDEHLTLAGDAYVALTPSALMAGGHLSADWHKGSLKAWFRMGLDLLLAWKPYHYEASLVVSIGGSYTFEFLGTHHISVSVSARLEIWGPPFAGQATIDLGITSVTAAFGSGRPSGPTLLSWVEFSGSFLPHPQQVCGIAVADGLLRTLRVGATDYTIVEPSALRVTVQSQVPLNDPASARVGVGPMGIAAAGFSSSVTIEVTDVDGAPVDADFRSTPIRRSVPAALWGQGGRPRAGDAGLVPDVHVGYEVTPARAPEARPSAPLDPAMLAYDTHLHAIDAEVPAGPTRRHAPSREGAAALARRFTDADAAARRAALTRSLRLPFDAAASPHAGLADQLRAEPLVRVARPSRRSRGRRG